MRESNVNQLKRLPLHDFHLTLGAKVGSFGEWEVPLYYTGVLDEHAAVRNRAGIFDVSHMGEFYFSGRGARETLDFILASSLERLSPGKALYSFMCHDEGGIVDDVIVYQLGTERYLLVVNAGCVANDFEWVRAHVLPDTSITNETETFGLLSLQGPDSVRLLQKLVSAPIDQIPYYSILNTSLPWPGAMVARTGYTGELGFEIFVQMNDLKRVYESLLDAGREFDVKSIGFGARDTLRLEAGMLLYGQDMDTATTPFEAGLGSRVSFEKEFVGKIALLKAHEQGARKTLVGFEMSAPGVARHGCAVWRSGEMVGSVTSGSFSPTLKKNIGLAYVAPPGNQNSDSIEIEIRHHRVPARIVPLPFYRRKPKRS